MNEVREERESPVWAGQWLFWAGVYNLLWGVITIAAPHLIFDLTGIHRLNYPEIWQCVGMIVGVYGIGYLIAAEDPRAHWPIVLVGLMGKIFGPIGFAVALLRGTFPPLFGLTILTNDLIWWIPFTMILWDAFRNRKSIRRPAEASLSHFTKETHIDAPPETVFAFHESPDALQQLIPPWEPMHAMTRDELRHLRLVLAIADAGADDQGVERRKVQRLGLRQRHHRCRMPLLFDDLLQALADAWRVAVGGGVGDQDTAHRVLPLTDSSSRSSALYLLAS